LGMSVQGSNELALRIPRYPTMSALYTQQSSQDAKLKTDEEQDQSTGKWETVLFKQNANFEQSQELKGWSEKCRTQ
jgi:hypothetical protein